MGNSTIKNTDLGSVAVSACRRWSQLAIYCFKRGCNCQGCYYNEFFENASGYKREPKCQMKAAVLETVRQLGIPKRIRTRGVIYE